MTDRHDRSRAEAEAIAAYAPMTIAFAKTVKHRCPKADLDELVSDGFYGLLLALRSTRDAEEHEFRSYAAKRVFGEMYEGLRRRRFIKRRGSKRGLTAHWSGEEELATLMAPHPSTIDLIAVREIVAGTHLTARQWQAIEGVLEDRGCKELALEHGTSQPNFSEAKRHALAKCRAFAEGGSI